jgi:hypothetical protein
MTNPIHVSNYRAREIVARRLVKMMISSISEETAAKVAEAESRLREVLRARNDVVMEAVEEVLRRR